MRISPANKRMHLSMEDLVCVNKQGQVSKSWIVMFLSFRLHNRYFHPGCSYSKQQNKLCRQLWRLFTPRTYLMNHQHQDNTKCRYLWFRQFKTNMGFTCLSKYPVCPLSVPRYTVHILNFTVQKFIFFMLRQNTYITSAILFLIRKKKYEDVILLLS